MANDDNALVSLLVEHVLDIEAAVSYIVRTIDAEMWKAASEILSATAKTWQAEGNFDPDAEDDFWIMPSDWATDPSRETGYDEDAWFSFSVSDAGKDDDVTSLAGFLGGGSPNNGMMLIFRQAMLKGRKWKQILAQQEAAVQSIRDAGFIVEQREGRIEFPIVLDRAKLISALADEDPAAAFEPLHIALSSCAAAKPHFDLLVRAARSSAYD